MENEKGKKRNKQQLNCICKKKKKKKNFFFLSWTSDFCSYGSPYSLFALWAGYSVITFFSSIILKCFIWGIDYLQCMKLLALKTTWGSEVKNYFRFYPTPLDSIWAYVLITEKSVLTDFSIYTHTHTHTHTQTHTHTYIYIYIYFLVGPMREIYIFQNE